MPRPAKLPDLSGVDITELKLIILAVLERHGIRNGAKVCAAPRLATCSTYAAPGHSLPAGYHQTNGTQPKQQSQTR